MWRPDGWENPLPEAYEIGDNSSPEDIWVRKFCQNTLNGLGHDMYEAGADAILNAVIEWGEEYCMKHTGILPMKKQRRVCEECWQSLRESVGEWWNGTE